MKRILIGPALALAGVAAATSGHHAAVSAATAGTTPAHQPAIMYTIPTTAAINGDTQSVTPAVQPPPVLACLPVTPPSPVPGCVPPPPPAGQPWPGNMAYFGGHVQVSPKIYLVFYGWGDKGAFSSSCATRPKNDPVPCDPQGAGLRMINFVSQLGGTTWAGTQTQYYETVSHNGNTYNEYISNPWNQLKGVWYDNTTPPINPHDSNPTAPGHTYSMLAAEAARAAAHFHVTDFANSQFVIAQPQNFSDPAAASAGYCAWHDYTEPGIEGGIYNKVKANISFTNMPYVLDQGSSCGENAVNIGAAGALDGFSIVLGHEIEETVTDPGAEDVLNGVNLGAWYDNFQYETGDKCAWVGSNLTGVGPNPVPDVPGRVGTMVGNNNGRTGQTFPVQSLWSNDAAGGLGYCAGAGTDLPSIP